MPGIAKESAVLEEGQSIPPELICGQCSNILLHPVMNTCPHLFCFGCVRKKLASTQSARRCPTCDLEWDPDPSPAPESVSESLKSLKFYCHLKCGAQLRSDEKDGHLKSDCPLYILNCPNKSEGCRFKIERRNVEEHLKACHYRKVNCEACGFRCLFVNLFGHQVVKRCVRDLLQKQYVQSLRKTHHELVNYSQQIKEDRIKTAQFKHNLEIRYKGLTPLRYRRFYSNYGTPSARHGSIYDELMSRPTTSLDFSSNMDFLRGCRRCDSKFKPSKNHDKACRYHREPFLGIFTEECGACGEDRESETPCLRGFHIPLLPASARPFSARTSGVRLHNGGDFNSPAELTEIKTNRTPRLSTARTH